MKLKPLSRRTFLRGSGAAIALPFLEAMLAPMKTWAQSQSPLRLVNFVCDNGFYASETDQGDVNLGRAPASSTARLAIPESSLAPLGDMRNLVTVYRGLQEERSLATNFHNNACFLTRLYFEGSTSSSVTFRDPGSGAILDSMDQLAADHLQGTAPIRILTLSPVHRNYLLRSAVSVRNGRIVSPTKDPRVLFDQLMGFNSGGGGGGGGNPGGGPDPVITENLSVLDRVKGDIDSLKTQLGTSDKHTLDRYLTSIEEVERALNSQNQSGDDNNPPVQSCTFPNRPPSIPSDSGLFSDSNGQLGFDTKFRLFLDLAALALECDFTRVISINVQDEKINYRGLDPRFPSNFHDDISHRTKDPSLDAIIGGEAGRGELFRMVNRYQMARFGEFLRRLNGSQDSNNNSILYNSVVFWGNNHSSSARHNTRNVSNLLAGSAGGRLDNSRGRIDIRKTNGEPFEASRNNYRTQADFMFTILDKLQLTDRIPRFGPASWFTPRVIDQI